MKIEWDGLDEMKNSLKQLEQNAADLDGQHEVSFDELFTKNFMSENTKFDDFQKFIDTFEPSDDIKFEDFDGEKFDMFVKENSSFEDWESMLESAGSEYFANKLFNGF